MTAILAILFVVYVTLQGADVFTTVAILKAGGRELNPMLNNLMARFGVLATLIATKVIVVSFVAWYVFYMQTYAIFVLLFLVALYAWVVVNNLRSIK